MSATRVVVSGLGRRAHKFWLPELAARPDVELVGVVDPDAARLTAVAASLGVATHADLGSSLDRLAPDVVVVCSPDHAHADDLVLALDRGLPTISEKPVVVSAAQLHDVARAAARSGAPLYVAHNFRHVNLHAEIHRLLCAGAVGPVVQVRLGYHLTPGHGTSYLQRWHRRRADSGGLQVTKSCHHFDLLGWWLDDRPETVVALGRLGYHADRHGLTPDADIEDALDVLVRYRSGAVAAYSLYGRSSWEGYELHVGGVAGTLSARFLARAVPGEDPPPHRLRVTRHDAGTTEVVEVPREPGSHAGADRRLADELFTGDLRANVARLANLDDAAVAVLTGLAVSASLDSHEQVRVDDPAGGLVR